MTAPAKPKTPGWLAWLKVSTAEPSVIESEYEPAFKVGERVTRLFLQTVAASIIVSAAGYVSALVFPVVLAHGSAEKALAAVVARFLYEAAQARGGPYDVSLLLGGLTVALLLVFVVEKFLFEAFDFYNFTDDGLDEIHEHLKLINDKLAEIYYALPTAPAKPADENPAP